MDPNKQEIIDQWFKAELKNLNDAVYTGFFSEADEGLVYLEALVPEKMDDPKIQEIKLYMHKIREQVRKNKPELVSAYEEYWYIEENIDDLDFQISNS